jgi:hypothetical protein
MYAVDAHALFVDPFSYKVDLAMASVIVHPHPGSSPLNITSRPQLDDVGFLDETAGAETQTEKFDAYK